MEHSIVVTNGIHYRIWYTMQTSYRLLEMYGPSLIDQILRSCDVRNNEKESWKPAKRAEEQKVSRILFRPAESH